MCYSNRDDRGAGPFPIAPKTPDVFLLCAAKIQKTTGLPKKLEGTRISRPVKGFVIRVESFGILDGDVCAEPAEGVYLDDAENPVSCVFAEYALAHSD